MLTSEVRTTVFILQCKLTRSERNWVIVGSTGRCDCVFCSALWPVLADAFTLNDCITSPVQLPASLCIYKRAEELGASS